ncbi:adenylate/guanylate cyclase domain-containing protein [Ruegeria sp. WL0004]|uniref:Adenylate/guanylate cyclase domain-containing protein n=1 Tax=Ruegeria marisflavi TaxID=2984152 RepID=A0ABT2WWQ3_9RHOB|nr:adenylate/guanylate cyclase domain-containing protein [Ruegeria sp. WL0004]MCU9839697.1 adenylate/guanylate cyclase domain-containing protein [Ruegeria sp. WL0004]
MERRIAAILAADMVGFSRLVEADEIGTLERQKAYRHDLIDPLIGQFQGQVVKLTGDGLIAEFSSVVAAVQFALTLQRQVTAREQGQPEDRRIRYRLAVNLGDVIFDEGDVYGDGVNIAARMEEMAEPGGIVVSGTVFDLLKSNVDAHYEPLGEKRLKNIATPVRVYRVVPGLAQGGARPEKARRRWPLLAVFCGAATAMAISLWVIYAALAGKPADLAPGKPSLAVLPLDNLSGDPSQDWFADGLSEDLTTDLSRHPGLFVIARNSAFASAETARDPVEVARMLKVAYVIEGSVRRVGETLRINVQLVDAGTGGHVWAERYDGTPEDVLAFIDGVSDAVLGALDLADPQNGKTVSTGETGNARAFDAFLEGWGRYKQFTPEDLLAAVPLFERAVELDPGYGRAYAALAATYFEAWEKFWFREFGYGPTERRFLMAKAERYLDLALQHPTGLAHQVAANIHRLNGRREDMLRSATAAVEAEPGDPDGYAELSFALVLEGRAKDALEAIETAMKLEPLYPAHYLLRRGVALFHLRRYDEAVEMLERAKARDPGNKEFPLYWLAATYGRMGELEKADAARMANKNRTTVDALKLYLPYKNPEDWEFFAEGMRKAGFR